MPRRLIWTSAWSGCTSCSRNETALGGSLHGSPLKQYFATSASSCCKPVTSALPDNYKSYIIQCLNLLYRGFVLSSFPTVKITYSHQVMVDVPKNSGSILDLILEINVVINLGCSSILLKNLNTAFWASI